MNVVKAEQKYNVDKDTGYVDKVMVYCLFGSAFYGRTLE